MADGHEVTTENRDALRGGHDRALPAAPAVQESSVYRKNVTSFARSAKKGELVVTELRGKEETRQTAYRSIAISPSSQLKRTLHFEPALRRAAPVGLSRLRPLLGTAQPHLVGNAPLKAWDQLGVGGRSTTGTDNGPPPSNQQGEKIENLTSKMEELRTSDENERALLNEEFSISSSEWAPNNDVEQANLAQTILPNLFDIDSHPSSSGSGYVASPPECQAATTDLSQNSTWSKLTQLSSSRDIPMKNSFATHPQSKSNPETKTCVVTLSTSPCSSSTPPKMSTGKKKKRRRERQHDMTHAVEVTPNDILFGRGGETNKHPGNVYFRERVLEWLQQYMKSSKEEKEEIAKVLLESFELEGRRFLEQIGDGGLYYKVVRGQHIKVSAALRDLKKKYKKEIEI